MEDPKTLAAVSHPTKQRPPPDASIVVAGSDADYPVRFEIITWITIVGFAFLTYNSVIAIVRSIDDPWMVCFVSATYLDLTLLFYCVRLVERTPPGDSPRRKRLKAAVWSLASLLTAMLAYRVAAIMPPIVSGLIWGMSAVTVVGGFYALFIYKEASAEFSEEGKLIDAFQKC